MYLQEQLTAAGIAFEPHTYHDRRVLVIRRRGARLTLVESHKNTWWADAVEPFERLLRGAPAGTEPGWDLTVEGGRLTVLVQWHNVAAFVHVLLAPWLEPCRAACVALRRLPIGRDAVGCVMRALWAMRFDGAWQAPRLKKSKV
jgi:hypothetical protein